MYHFCSDLFQLNQDDPQVEIIISPEPHPVCPILVCMFLALQNVPVY